MIRYLVGVCQQQDLCDGSWRADGIKGWELSAGGRQQLHSHHLGKRNFNKNKTRNLLCPFLRSKSAYLRYGCLKADVGDRAGG